MARKTVEVNRRLLRQLREERGWSLAEVGRQLGGRVSYGHYRNVEYGQVEPTMITLHKIAELFDLSGYDLLANPDEYPREPRPWEAAS